MKTSQTLSHKQALSGMTGWQVPPIFISQKYKATLVEEALEFLESLGLYYDAWQKLVLREMLGVKSDGTWASPDFGLVVGRQNGKSEIAIARILIGLFLIKEPLIVYSAHLADTASEIFLRLVGIIGEKDDPYNPNQWLHQYIKHVWFANGKQGIEVVHKTEKADGTTEKLVCRLKIKTRTGGGGRGFTANCLILDEAMVLSHAFIAALGPTQSAIENPQTIAMGSAGNQDSEYFGHLRSQAFVEDARDITWMEWSAVLCNDYCEDECDDDEHDDPFCEETYAKSNPAYGIRISKRAVEKDRRNLDYVGFIIERLSVGDWPLEIDEFKIITREAWDEAEDGMLDTEGKGVFAITTSPDRLASVIVAAGFTNNEERAKVLLQITGNETGIDMRAGTKWVVARAVELWKKWKPYAFVIDSKGQAGTFIEKLEDKGVKVISPQALEYAQSCPKLVVAVTGTKNEPRYVYHMGQTEMTMAVAAADKRNLSGLWAWARATEVSNIIALEAATIALWGLEKEAAEYVGKTLWVV